jgi:hypothetical protein
MTTPAPVKPWTEKDIAAARAAIEAAPTLSAGYEAAAAKLGRTVKSVQLARERGALGPVEPKTRTIASDIAALKEKDAASQLGQRNRDLLSEVARLTTELDAFRFVSRGPKIIKAPSTKGRNPKQRAGAAVLLCSDWHVEEPVYPEMVNGMNEYNLVIADERISRLEKGAAWLVNDPRFDLRTMVVGLLGDLISGYIHDELVESNLLSPQEGIVWLLDRVEKMLRRLAILCPTVERFIVPCTSGNHGRATQKQRVSTREANSNEQVLYQTLARVMRDDPRFEFQIAAGHWVHVDCMGFDLAFTHGDTFKYGGGVGGITIPIKRGINRQFAGRKVHQFNMGHFHTRTADGKINVNGSLIGYSNYSEFIHAEPEPPVQSFYIVDAKHGKGPEAPVWCASDEDPRAAESFQAVA